MLVYFNGDYLPLDEVRISPQDRGFLFADGAYEVVRVYNGRLFQNEAHIARLKRSLAELKIEGVDCDALRDIPLRLIEENNLTQGDATVYFQVTRGAAPRLHAFPADATPTVYLAATPFDPPVNDWENGIKVIVMPDIRWTRCDIKSVSLLPNVLANEQAHVNDAYEALFVRDGAITEGTCSNFGAIRDGCLYTYPEAHYILSGITRMVVLQLCQEIDLPVREYPILKSELPQLDEAFLMGTTTEVMPIVQIGDHKVGQGQPGPLTRKIQAAFREAVSRI